MNVKKCFSLALAAGTVFATGAFATPLPEMAPVVPMFGEVVGIDVTPGLSGPGVGGGYNSRVILPVYDTNDTTPGALGAGACYIAEDINFMPGPWASAATRAITEVQWQFQCVGWTAGPAFPQTNTPTADFDTVFEFWNSGDFTAQPSMLGAQTAPFAVRIVRTTVGTNFGWTVTSAFATPVSIPASNVWVAIKYVQVGTYGTTGPGIRMFDGSAGSANPAGESATAQLVNPRVDGTQPNGVGSTTTSIGRERSGDNIFLGDPVGGGTTEHFIFATAQSIRFQGDATIPTPTIDGDTICGPDLADGLTTRAGDLTGDADRVKWYRVCLPGDATDAALQFLDIDTETSATSVAVGIFGAGGNRLGCDVGLDGSAGNSQISFGVGRRAEFAAGGQQYDGRSGTLLASTGTDGYYIAVAPQGSSFGSGFTVNVNAAGVDGPYVLRLNTNVNGTPVGPSVPPLINGTDYGVITTPSATPGFGVVTGLDSCTGLGGVVWNKFQLDQAADGNNYLDIDFSALSPNTDSVAYIFDDLGNELAFDDISGPLPDIAQFSFGADSPARTYPPNPVPFDGNIPIGNTGLPAGTYYMAISLFPTQDLSALGGNGRWHVRGTSGSNLTVGADLYTGTVSPCGSADFDGDGDTGTDLDIEAFFACLGGVCCDTCGSADFDGDGDTGTDLDIEAFFRVLGGGEC